MPLSSTSIGPAAPGLSTVSPTRGQVVLVLSATVLSWLGEYLHNLFELPDLTITSPENSIPALISLGLFMVWWRSPFKRTAAILLVGWALLHLLVGGLVTVLPLSFLPFYPEQSLQHYSAHTIYAVMQLPLLVLLLRQLRATVV